MSITSNPLLGVTGKAGITPSPVDADNQFSVAYRIDKCKGCAHLSVLHVCKQCGCFMPAKVRMQSARCPIGMWESVPDTSGSKNHDNV